MLTYADGLCSTILRGTAVFHRGRCYCCSGDLNEGQEGRIFKMKRSATFIGIMMLIFCVSLLFMTGCAKKSVSKDEGLAAGEKKAAPAEVKPTPAIKPSPEESRELALRRDADAAAEAEREKAQKAGFEDVRFAYDKAVIEPAAREILKKHAAWLLKNKNYALVIEGHCDERGTVEYNLALGQRRADAAMKYIADLGVNRADIATISYGKERPLDPGQNEGAWAKNRRANFAVKLKK
jgi:peptidoglycan-associated lipoprotein